MTPLLRTLKVDFSLSFMSLFLLTFQSGGIRFFDGQGSFLLLLILVLRLGTFQFQSKDLKRISIVLVILLSNFLMNGAYFLTNLLFQFGLFIETYVVLIYYRKIGSDYLLKDFENVLKFIFIHASIGYLIFILFPSLFNSINISESPYRTFMNIFYVAETSSGLARNTGLMWEPGVLQLILNLLLFLWIRKKKHTTYLVILIIAIFTTFSTTGFILLALNFIFYIHVNQKHKFRLFALLLLSFFITLPFITVQENIISKFDSNNTSALVRLRDARIGTELIINSPLIGNGQFDSEHLSKELGSINIEKNVFSDNYLDQHGEMSGGFTNGFLLLICWYGIPFSILIYWFLFKNCIIHEQMIGRTIFMFLLILTFFSEPLTNTAFFLLFPLSYIILKDNNKPRLLNL